MDKIKELAEEISKELTKIELDEKSDVTVTVTIASGRVDINLQPKLNLR